MKNKEITNEIKEIIYYIAENVQKFYSRYNDAIIEINSNKWKGSLYLYDMKFYNEISNAMWNYFLNYADPYRIENYQMPYSPEDIFGIYRDIYGLPAIKKD